LRHGLSATDGEDDVKLLVLVRFFDLLPQVLVDAAPMPREESGHAQVGVVLAAAEHDAKINAAMTRAAVEPDTRLLTPLVEFPNQGANSRAATVL
jgi:hypothetical protein